MKLRTKFLIFVVILHLITLVLSFMIFRENKLWFLFCELLIIISIVISWNFYKQLIEPLKRLTEGIESIRDKDFNIKLVKTGKEEMDQLIDVYNAMMEELRLERTRQEQQHFFLEKLISTSPTAIIILDFDGRVKVVNQKAIDYLKVPENSLLNRKLEELDHAVIPVMQALQVGESKTVTLSGMEMFKIQRSQLIDRGFARSFIMMEKLTEEILAAEKKVYGKVIRMMAHEVNNSIGPVNSIILSTLTNSGLWNNGDHYSLRNALEVAMARNENLNLFTSNLAELVKLPEPVKRNIDLLKLVRSVSQLMEIRAQEKSILFQLGSAVDSFIIEADEAQMEQVLINIIKNSIESIGSKGLIRFSLSGRQLTITDNGKGISTEDEPHVFSPFFSTKREGQGIGLTLVREVLMNHGFEFSLQTNRLEQETVFRVEF